MGFSQQHAWSPVIRSNGPMDSAHPRNTGEEMAEEVWASTGVMAVKLLPGVKRDPLRLPHPGKHWLYMWVGRGPTYPLPPAPTSSSPHDETGPEPNSSAPKVTDADHGQRSPKKRKHGICGKVHVPGKAQAKIQST